MTRIIMVGVWVMIAAIFSMVITIPLGVGQVSGTAFAIGMVYSWIAGLMALGFWTVRRLRQNRNGS